MKGHKKGLKKYIYIERFEIILFGLVFIHCMN